MRGFEMINLTERENNVLHYLSLGLKNKEIAKKLNISVHTVKAHLETIYEKMSVNNRVQATLKAAYIGAIDLREIILK